MKPKTYTILQDRIASGIELGWRRAHKHDENPDPTQIQNAIGQAIMGEINEYFTFEDDEE
jgi:hypothetical protein